MMHVAPLLRSTVERVSRVPWAFDSLRWILEGGYGRHRELLERHFQAPPRRVLDCGCGTGIYAPCFSPDTYVGIDICPAYVARARHQHPAHRFQEMDATRLAFADNSFDAVIVCGVVHHLDESTTQRVLSEIARVLRPEGQLLLWEDVPTRDRWNFIGHWVHQLDVGTHIRPAPEYAQLLQPFFQVEATQWLRSGCMDYAAFLARKSARSDSPRPPSLTPPNSFTADTSLPASGMLTT